MDCRQVTEDLLKFIRNPDLPLEEVDAAMEHFRTCAACRRKLGSFGRALATSETDRLTCGQCQDQLPGYLYATQTEQADRAQWRPVVLHLATCPHCADVYAELSALHALAESARGAEPVAYAAPQLAFLQKKRARTTRRPWRLDRLGRLVIAFSAELLGALQPAPQPGFAGASVKANEASRVLYSYTLNDAVEDLELTISAEEQRDDADRCTVTVQVHIPSRGGWPNLGGVIVTLKRGRQELATQTTDAFGNAVFAGIALADLPRLVFRIES